MPTRHLPAPQPQRGTHALARRNETFPARALTALPAKALPLARGSLVAAGAALATEYALRAALGGRIERMLTPAVREAPTTIRTELIEWTVIERLRRP